VSNLDPQLQNRVTYTLKFGKPGNQPPGAVWEAGFDTVASSVSLVLTRWRWRGRCRGGGGGWQTGPTCQAYSVASPVGPVRPFSPHVGPVCQPPPPPLQRPRQRHHVKTSYTLDATVSKPASQTAPGGWLSGFPNFRV